MKVIYYINDIKFCECEVGSLIDLAIQDMQKGEREKQSKYIYDLISNCQPIQVPTTKKRKDILYNLSS